MASDWYDHCDHDFSDESYPVGRSTNKRRRMREIVDAYENHTYGGYAYDYSEYEEAKGYLERHK